MYHSKKYLDDGSVPLYRWIFMTMSRPSNASDSWQWQDFPNQVKEIRRHSPGTSMDADMCPESITVWKCHRKLPLCDECSLILFSTSTFYQGLAISSPPLTPCSKHPSSQAANVSPPENMYQPMPVFLCLCLSFFFLVVPVRSVPNPYKSWHWESAHFLLGYIIPTFFHYNLHLLHLLQLQSSVAIVGLLQVDVRVKRKTKKKFEQSFKSHVFWC